MPAAGRRRKNPEDTSKPKLWTAKICPFAHRARIALHHKGVEYEPIEVDLGNKPEGLLKVNPYGLVPVIEDQGNIIYESAICVEYIDEMWESPSGKDLMPKDPAGKAKARIWIDFMGKKIIPNYYAMMKEEKREEAKKNLLEGLKTFSAAMTSPGPFFFGEDFGAVDLCLSVYAQRFIVLKEFFQFEIPNTDEFKRYHVWWEALQHHPTFKATQADREYLIESARKVIEVYSKRTFTN